MQVELLVSIISAVAALGAVVITAVLGARAGRESLRLKAEFDVQQAAQRKREERSDLMNQIRDPILWAAFDLQSRIFNIVQQGFFSYRLHGDDHERAYALRSTIYLFSQYLSWMEIVRRSVQFLDLGDNQLNRELVNYFSKGTSILSSDAYLDSPPRIFRGDQRAIGEVMITTDLNAKFTCIGYAEFCYRMDSDETFASWLTPLANSIERFAARDSAAFRRLVAFQRNLIDLIDLLDPDKTRFPEWQRSRLEEKPLREIEMKVLIEYAKNVETSEIAEQLGISRSTAAATLRMAIKKLGVRDRSEAFRVAHERGFL